MKKLSVLLAIFILLSVFSITAYAQQDIPVTAVVSETDEGELSIKIYMQDIKKLVSMRVLVEYDVSEYTLKQGKASTYTDEYGDELENVSGLWTFGSLANKTGCAGAFVSIDGVTKSGETEACEFILTSVDGVASTNDVVVFVTELVTDDNNLKNDIREKTVISFVAAVEDKEIVFNYITEKEAATLTGLVTENEAVFIPEELNGLKVRRISTDEPCDIPILVFGRNILGANRSSFSEKTVAVAPEGSAPIAAVRQAGGKYLAYNESVVVDAESKLLYTDKFLVNSVAGLFSGTAGFDVEPSYIYAGGYVGTGTVVRVSSGNKTMNLTLCVKGDANGDSVCDAIDVALCERFANGLTAASSVEVGAADLNCDGDVTVEDYAQTVNLALSGEYTLFEGVRGDLNGDYTVDILDIAEFNRLRNRTDLTQTEKALCDFNNDGEITDGDKELLTEILFDFI